MNIRFSGMNYWNWISLVLRMAEIEQRMMNLLLKSKICNVIPWKQKHWINISATFWSKTSSASRRPRASNRLQIWKRRYICCKYSSMRSSGTISGTSRNAKKVASATRSNMPTCPCKEMKQMAQKAESKVWASSRQIVKTSQTVSRKKRSGRGSKRSSKTSITPWIIQIASIRKCTSALTSWSSKWNIQN